MSDLVGNPEDRLPHVAAHIIKDHTKFMSLCMAFSWLQTHSHGSKPSAMVKLKIKEIWYDSL